MNIQKARNEIAKAFKDDPDFRKGYEANIAMLIYDDQNIDLHWDTSKRSTHLKTIEGCNYIADKILTLIFEKPIEISEKEKEIITRYQILDI